MATKDYANTRYSTLEQTSTSNLKGLELAWSFSRGQSHGHEATPLWVTNKIYVVTPFPHILLALDPADGAKKWESLVLVRRRHISWIVIFAVVWVAARIL